MPCIVAQRKSATSLFRQYFKFDHGVAAIEYYHCRAVFLAVLISIVGTGCAVGGIYRKLTADTGALN